MFKIVKVSGRLAKVQRRMASHSKCQEIITQNQMPIPAGDFYQLQRQRNCRHSSILGLGIAMLTSALFSFSQSKLIKLNLSPPVTYESE